MTKSRNIQARHIFWTPDQLVILRARYPHESTKKLAAEFNRTIGQIYTKAAKLGLQKTAAYLTSPDACRLRRGDQLGAAYRFQKGQVSHNKGVKGISYPGMVATQFKPGVRQGVAAQIYQPIGAERTSKDGYHERKINDNLPFHRRWRAVHILNWEAVNGPLPKGHAITFKDGNKQNTEPDNLELISRAEIMKRNSVYNLPPQLRQIIQLNGALKRRIRNAQQHRD